MKDATKIRLTKKYTPEKLKLLEEQRRSGSKGELQKLWQQEQDKLLR